MNPHTIAMHMHTELYETDHYLLELLEYVFNQLVEKFPRK